MFKLGCAECVFVLYVKEVKSNNFCKLSVVLSGLALAVAVLVYLFPRKADTAISGTNDSIRTAVREIIREDPQMLLDVLSEEAMRRGESEARQMAQQLASSVLTRKDEILKQSIKFGKDDSKNEFICFFDPKCKPCVEFQKTMVKMVEAKKDVVFHLLPVAVLSEDSKLFGKIYMVVYSKDRAKAMKFIDEITKAETADKEALESALKKAGFDKTEVEKQLDSGDKKLMANGALADSLKIPAVPAMFFVRGNDAQMVHGVDEETLEKIIAGGGGDSN